MKKICLQLLHDVFTGKHYRRQYAVRLAMLVAVICGFSAVGLAQTSVAISSPTPVGSSNVCPGAANVNLFAFTLTGSGAGVTNVVSAISFSNTGTASIPTDYLQYRLWKNAGGGAGTLVATSTSTSFTGLSEAFVAGTVLDYWITIDVAAAPTAGNTISLAAIPAANITSSNGAGFVTGSAAAQGTLTARALPTVASLTAGPTPICGGQTLTLTAGGTTGTGGLTSYNWAGPAGSAGTTVGNVNNYTTPTLNASGNYSVTVTYPGAGCTSLPAVSSAVVVNDQPDNPAGAYLCTNIPMTNFAATNLNRNGITGATWVSSNNAVATVDAATGLTFPDITAPVGGTVTITATKGGCSAVTTGTIAARPSRILSSGTPAMTYQLCTGSTLVLSSATTGASYTWSSDNVSIASVTNGAPQNVTTVTGGNIDPASGTVTLHYTNTLNTCDTVVFIDVNPRPFAINGPAVHPHEVCLNSSINLTSISPNATWTSSASGIASVLAGPAPGTTGIVTGNSLGVANITYAFNATGCFRTYSVTVNAVPAPITGFSVTCTGQSTTLATTSTTGTWSSSVPSVATVPAVGTSPVTVSGVVAGFTNILYTFPTTGCSSVLLVQVNQQPGPITGPSQVCAGSTILLGNAVGGGTWQSTPTSVATIDLTSGLLYGQYSSSTPQIAQVDYNLTGCLTVSKDITVNPAPGPINGVQNVCIGGTTYLSDTTLGGVWSKTDFTGSISFTPAAPSILGVSVGHSVVTYTLPSSGCYDTAIVIIYPNPDPIVGPDSVCQGAMVTLSNATPGGTWSSTILSIAQVIDTSGVVTGVSAGNAIISYNLPTGCFDTASMRVKPPVVATVSITRDPGGITCDGMIDDFIATQTNGGIPDYQWYKFVTPVGTNSAIYTPTVQTNGDLIVVKMTTHFSCAVDTVVYDSLVAVVYPIANTQIDITSAPLNPVASFLGQVYTFTSVTTFGGGATAYQWYLNGVAIPGATSSIYTTPVYADGYYHCEITGFSPCNFAARGISDSIHIIATYLDVAATSATVNDLVLFPNPSTGNITLRGTVAGNGTDDVTYEIIDVLGHVVFKGAVRPQNSFIEQQIELGNSIPAGTYMLRVNAGTENQAFRFIISR